MEINEDMVSFWQWDPNFERFFDCRWYPHFKNFKVSSVKFIYCSYNCETKSAGASVNSSLVGRTAVINIWTSGLTQRTLEAKILIHQSFSNYFFSRPTIVDKFALSTRILNNGLSVEDSWIILDGYALQQGNHINVLKFICGRPLIWWNNREPTQ
jgi:hypothetical protein